MEVIRIKQESGRSMIEMLGVLAIMGVITVGAIEMIQLAMNTQKRNTVNEEVLQIVTQVRNIHGEYDAFQHILKNASGAIKLKIDETFGSNVVQSI